VRPPRAALAFLVVVAMLPGAVAQPTAKVALTKRLAEWRDEIEALGRGKMVLARVYADPQRTRVYLPPDADERPIIVQYLRNTNFLKDFLATHAVNINHKGSDGWYYIILVNMSRAAEWDGHEEAVLANQFGHAWLYAENYPFPTYEGKSNSCMAMLAVDAVQHVIIQDELKRRSISYAEYWIPLLEKMLGNLRRDDTPASAKLPPCFLIGKLVLWVEVRLTLSPETWADYTAFNAAMAKKYPILAKQQDEIYRLIAGKRLRDVDVYQRVLENVLNSIYGFAKLVLGVEVPAEPPPTELKITPTVIEPARKAPPAKK